MDDAWTAVRENYDGCSCESLRAGHQEMKTVKMKSDEDLDEFFYKKDRCRDRLNFVTPKEGPSDRQYEDIILQWLPPEYGRICQIHIERDDYNDACIRWMVSKIYADILAFSNSESSRGIAGRGGIMQATGWDLININPHYYMKLGHNKND